ncbi:hypothetical protein PM082_009839 [Marasmius tenuissimus]|nr:hypothetical protein PM082_009839 [Marasmius tenuissimus]
MSILIVGAGPTGLVLALLLSKNGVSVRIIEKNESIPHGQRGAGLTPRTLELYKILGILPEIERESYSIRKMRFYQSPEGDTPGEDGSFLEEVEEQPEYYRTSGTLLGQDDHQRILADILKRDFEVPVEYSTGLTSFANHNDHVVAHISKDGKEETTRFNWIVGADGARSIVRKQAGLTFLGDTYPGTTLVVGDIEVKQGFDEELSVMKFWGKFRDRQLCMRPYRKGGQNYYFFFLGGANLDGAKVASGRDALLESIYDIIGKRYIEFGELRNIGLWTANVRMVDSFSKGRAFLVGDAAHVHSPTGGQGMTSGVQDSINLGWKLSLVEKGLAPQSLLDSYSLERLPIIATMLEKTTRLMHKTFQKASGNGTDGWTRRDTELAQFGVNYRGSSLLVDERYTDADEPVDPYRSGLDGSAHAGDRAPSAPGLILSRSAEATTCGLYDFFDMTSHAIVVFSRPDSPLVDEVQRILSGYGQDLLKGVVIFPQGTTGSSEFSMKTVVDGEGYAYKHFKVPPKEELVAVIRPDGYIGATVKGSPGLKKYLSNVFH